MAFRDENGKITIDEVAAEADITKINQAQEKLETALNALKAMQIAGNNCNGNTADSINEKSGEMIKMITDLLQHLDETSEYIRHVVAVYREKDLALKQMMEQK